MYNVFSPRSKITLFFPKKKKTRKYGLLPDQTRIRTILKGWKWKSGYLGKWEVHYMNELSNFLSFHIFPTNLGMYCSLRFLKISLFDEDMGEY